MQQQYRLIFFVFVFSMLAYRAAAQVPGYKVFRTDDNSIKIFSVYKDHTGYILAGTSDGLYKFDGGSFTKIESSRPGIHDTVTVIFQDRKNNIWVGCNSGRIANAVNGKLMYTEPEEGTPKKRITCFLQDSRDNIWFGTAGEGVYYFYNRKLYLVNEENGLSDLNIHSLAMAANGDVLVATDQGINACTTNNNKTTVKQVGPQQGLPDYIVTGIFPAGNNGFWIGLQDKGFCFYNYTSKKITVPAVVSGWNKGQVNALFYTHEKLWVATQDSGLLCFSPARQQFISSSAAAMPQKTITGLLEDNQGNMWMIADNKVLVRAALNTLLVHPVYNEDFFVTVHTILADSDNSFWTGTDMAVVKYTYNGHGYVGKKYPVAGLDMKTDITSLYQDKYGNIWIGSMGKGIFVLDPSTGKTRQLAEALSNGSILSITGRDNIVCTAGLEGAIIFELTDDNTTISNNYHFTEYNKIETIGSTYIYNVFRDSHGRTWFATDGQGLTMLYNGIYTHYNKANGIKDEHVYSVTEDKSGKIWFSTSNAGVYSFDGHSFTNFGLKEGLSSLSASTVKADQQGNIIVVHKEGLDIIDAKTGSISYVNAAQGITDINDDLGAACTNSAGDIFVAVPKGIVQYTAPGSIRNAPQTIIENVQLFLNNIDTAALHYFKYDENNIRFNFSGLYYTDPGNVFLNTNSRVCIIPGSLHPITALPFPSCPRVNMFLR